MALKIGSRFCSSSKNNGTIEVLLDHDLYKVSIPLPSIGTQLFHVENDSSSISKLLRTIELEDSAIKSVHLYTMDGKRLSRSVYVKELMLNDFMIKINDKIYNVISPIDISKIVSKEKLNDLAHFIKSGTKNSIDFSLFVKECEDRGIEVDELKHYILALSLQHTALYIDNIVDLKDKIHNNPDLYQKIIIDSLNVELLKKSQIERIKQLEILKNEFKPLAEEREKHLHIAFRRYKLWTYTGLILLFGQFVMFARLTWWDYSWDVIEPFTYFTNFVQCVLAAFIFYLVRKEEFSYELGRNIYINRLLKRFEKKKLFDVEKYNTTKKKIEDLEELIHRYEIDKKNIAI